MPKRLKYSRAGCKQCKIRHVKCDEGYPSCVNCSVANRSCSFLVYRPYVPPHILTSSGASSHQFRSRIPAQVQSQQKLHVGWPESPSYGLHELELFHHLENGLAESLVALHDKAIMAIRHSIELALSNVYLLNQMLAVSALHLSTLRPEKSARYRHHALLLQNQALALFQKEVHGGTSKSRAATFAFSTFISYQVLFETFRGPCDFSVFLGSLQLCAGLQRSMRAVSIEHRASISAEFHSSGLQNCTLVQSRIQRGESGESSYSGSPLSGSETRSAHMDNGRRWCRMFASFLKGSDCDCLTRDACLDALDCLSRVFQTYSCEPSRSTRSTLSWFASVPESFIKLLHERSPQALTIFSYYAVLLHQIKDFWIVNNIGEFIIRSVTTRLEGAWAPWLAWPNDVLSKGSSLTLVA